MKFLNTALLLHIFLRVFIPSHWLKYNPACPIYDAWLNALLDTEPVVSSGRVCSTIFLNEHEIWVARWAYSYGQLLDKGRRKFYEQERLPFIQTQYRLKAYIEDNMIFVGYPQLKAVA